MDSTINIETGMSVIRYEAALKPIVGTVQSIFTTGFYDPETKAVVIWQDATRRFNGNTSTTSTIDVTKLLEATNENIEAMKTKAREVTPMMKKAMGLWREHVETEEYVKWNDIRERLSITWDQWWKGYEKACEKLRVLGYLDPHEDNRNQNTGNRSYRIATKTD